FLSRYESFRSLFLSKNHFVALAHFGERAFDSIGGAVVSTAAFVSKATRNQMYPGTFLRLVRGRNESEKSGALRAAAVNSSHEIRFHVSTEQLEGVAGSPVAYWLSEAFFNMFS